MLVFQCEAGLQPLLIVQYHNLTIKEFSFSLCSYNEIQKWYLCWETTYTVVYSMFPSYFLPVIACSGRGEQKVAASLSSFGGLNHRGIVFDLYTIFSLSLQDEMIRSVLLSCHFHLIDSWRQRLPEVLSSHWSCQATCADIPVEIRSKIVTLTSLTSSFSVGICLLFVISCICYLKGTLCRIGQHPLAETGYIICKHVIVLF